METVRHHIGQSDLQDTSIDGNLNHAKKTRRFRRPTRCSFLKSMLAAGAAAWFVPSFVLGGAGAATPSNKITLGALGVGAQGFSDMQGFLRHDDGRVTALCDVNKRNIERARSAVAERYGSSDVKVFADFREMNADPSIDAVLMALPVHWHSVPSADAIQPFSTRSRWRCRSRRRDACAPRCGRSPSSSSSVRSNAPIQNSAGPANWLERPAGQAQGNPRFRAGRQTRLRLCGTAVAGLCRLESLGWPRADDALSHRQARAPTTRTSPTFRSA